MAISYDEVHALKGMYEDVYRTRHEAFRSLRRYWHGDFWMQAESEQGRPITSVFRDLTSHLSDVGPEIKLVHNVIQMVCNKYQTYLSPLPQIRVWVDPPETDNRRAQATRKQRYLYGVWSAGNMARIFNNIAWYLPLMGDCYLGIHPDFDRNIPSPLIRSPEFAYPIPSFDKHSEQAVIFSWKVHESVVARNFAEYSAPIEQMRAGMRGKFKRGQSPDPQMTITEYSDDVEWHRWLVKTVMEKNSEKVVGAQEANGVVHNFGFNLFEHLKFIEIPDEMFGHGAVEQAINLNEMGNALYSLMFQAVIENVFPRLILENPAMAPEEIESGPGAVIPLNAGGKAYYLQPEGPMVQHQSEFARFNEVNIRNVTGVPGVAFGESPATSIVTGKAVNELEGAGTGSMIEMVQGVGIGDGIVAWNEKAITIGQRMFRDDTAYLFGVAYKSTLDLVPQRFAITTKGKELVGSAHNDVIFSPAIDPHEKLVMWLQAKGGGLVSDKFIREQVGIPDNEAMVEEIYSEAVEQAVLGFYLGQLQQNPTEEAATNAEDQAFAYLQGDTSSPHPLTQLPAGPAPAGPPQAGPGPGAAAPAGPPGALPPGGPPPAALPPGPPQAGQPVPAGVHPGAGPQVITLDDVSTAFQGLQGIQGRVFLLGEIVAQRQTSGDIEVGVTEKPDQQAIQSQLPQYSGRLIFHTLPGTPREAFLEVTPGKVQARGGAGAQNPEALAGVFQG